MIPPILGALGKFLIDNGVQVWPEEIPRTDTAGNAINPQAGSVTPTIWPATQLVLRDKSLRDNTFEDSYSENPPVVVQVWGTSREEVDPMMSKIEGLLAQAQNWFEALSPIGIIFTQMGFPQFWLYDLEIHGWTSQQRENERLAGSLFCWLAEMDLTIGLHGVVETY